MGGLSLEVYAVWRLVRDRTQTVAIKLSVCHLSVWTDCVGRLWYLPIFCGVEDAGVVTSIDEFRVGKSVL